MLAGDLFRADQTGGINPHYWVALEDPDENGEFLAANFTDARKYSDNKDVWPAQSTISNRWKLSKPSVVAVAFTLTWSISQCEAVGAVQKGKCPQEVLVRVRCNLVRMKDDLAPLVRERFDQLEGDWAIDCQ